jgi:hypothetical protein
VLIFLFSEIALSNIHVHKKDGPIRPLRAHHKGLYTTGLIRTWLGASWVKLRGKEAAIVDISDDGRLYGMLERGLSKQVLYYINHVHWRRRRNQRSLFLTSNLSCMWDLKANAETKRQRTPKPFIFQRVPLSN